MGIKTRAKKLQIVSYSALALSIILFFVLGLARISVMSDGGAYLLPALIAMLTFQGGASTGSASVGHLLGIILLIVVILCFIAGLVMILVYAKKFKRNSIYSFIVHLVVWAAVTILGIVVFEAYKVPVAQWCGQIFVDITGGTAIAFVKFFAFLLFVLCVVFYILTEALLLIEALSYCKRPEEDYCGDDELTEEKIRSIIREELKAFYGEHPVEEKPAEPVAEEKKEEPVAVAPVVEEKPAEPVVEEKKEEPAPKVEEEEEEEPKEEVDDNDESFDQDEATGTAAKALAPLHLKPEDLDGNGRISFVERMMVADESILDIYNVLKNRIMSYGVNSRISASGDTFRLHRQTFAKLTISGKKVKVYLALNPDDYKDSTIPFMDVGHKKSFADIPFAFKVKSGLSIRRACELIDATMAKGGLDQKHEPSNKDYSHELVEELKAIKEGK